MNEERPTGGGRRSTDPDIAVMQATLSDIHETVVDVLEQAKLTNGRVTTLEQARAVAEALAAQRVLGRDWLLRILVGLGVLVGVIEPVVFFLAAR